MLRRKFLSMLPAAAGATAAAAKPNIVLLLADDMGYSDIGCFGSEMRTPNIDALAKRGVRFTQFYNTARCCPSRASLLTGMYSHQVGIGHMVDDKGKPGYRGDLSLERKTVAELLGEQGYRCYMTGKWHVTPGGAKSQRNWPLQRGFHRYFGTLAGGHHFAPRDLVDGNERVPAPEEFYHADAMAERSVRYLREHDAARPFFLYTAFTTPHFPMQCPEEDVARQRGRYAMGWERLRAERYERMKRLGIVDAKWRLPERDRDVAEWASAPNKEWEQRRMEVYAGMVERMDRRIGDIVAQVRAMGQEENTLFLFLSDNGGSPELMDAKNTVGRVPEKLKAAGRWMGNDPSVMPGPKETYQSYGASWASASNTPFRRYKAMTHEGGISTPLIAAWGSRVKRAGRLCEQPGHLIDVLPSCVAAAGGRVECEGRSFLDVLGGGKRPEQEGLYFEHEGNQAVRQGQWKLVKARGGAWELYDMEADRTETRDLASVDRGRVEKMEKDYRRWMERCGVEEWPVG